MTTQISHAAEYDISPAVADRLRRTAEALEREWATLDAGFVSDRLLEALAVLRKHGPRREDGTRRTAAEQAEFAEALLRRFCHGTGRRDAARRSRAEETGRRPLVVSLDALVSQGWDVPSAHPQADWLRDLMEAEDAATLPRDLARHLEARGRARERAWMFVWAEYEGLEWQAVARRMEERFEARHSLPALRKWASNNFPTMRADAAVFFARRYGEDDCGCHTAPRPAHSSGGRG